LHNYHIYNMRHFLYRHIRQDKNQPFYIGIGTKGDGEFKTFNSEYYRAFSKQGRNTIWKSIVVRNPKYEVEILMESDDYVFIKNKETEFVKIYGRINNNTGILSNLTDGGDGTLGSIKSIEVRERISNSH